MGKSGLQARHLVVRRVLTQPKLLIIDEVGYIPIDRQGANLFFRLISRRYERGSILVTSSQSLGAPPGAGAPGRPTTANPAALSAAARDASVARTARRYSGSAR